MGYLRIATFASHIVYAIGFVYINLSFLYKEKYLRIFY